MHLTKALAGLALTTALAGTAGTASAAEITLMRFFGDCQNDHGGMSSPADANGECGIITALVNRFNAENEAGHVVAVRTANRGAYYDLLAASQATGDIPDVAAMHATALPNFASRGLLLPLDALFQDAGIDTSDFLEVALENATHDGQVFALPFDLNAILFHLNMDLMEQAGLVNDDGTPMLPTSPEEFIAMGRRFEEATGRNYVATGTQGFDGVWARMFQAFGWQQGLDVLSQDGATASIDSPEGLEIAGFMKSIFDEGLIDGTLDDAGADQAFLNGEAGIRIGGTGLVDGYSSQAAAGGIPLENYGVGDFPNLFGQDAAWGDSHMWVVPVDDSRPPEEMEAVSAFLAFLDDNGFQWSRTGHLPARRSVIDSPEFRQFPHRSGYLNTAQIMRNVPQALNQRGILDTMTAELNAMWLSDAESEAALEAAQAGVNRILRRGDDG